MKELTTYYALTKHREKSSWKWRTSARTGHTFTETPSKARYLYCIRNNLHLSASKALPRKALPIGLSGLLGKFPICPMTQSLIYLSVTYSLNKYFWVSTTCHTKCQAFCLCWSLYGLSSLTCPFVSLTLALNSQHKAYTVLTKYWNPTYLQDSLQTNISFPPWSFLVSLLPPS